ncbi:MAG TPA: methyltransferase domain-containing protein [Pirellulaceae bacterium]|nr:methyltransferase domain-containing protein [Pirellulaceae bacterium]
MIATLLDRMARKRTTPEREAARRRVVAYFDASNRDYGVWSDDFNMHFGFWRRGLAPWRLEPMLRQMSLEIVDRLGIADDRPVRLVDLGGGVGASARTIARRYPLAEIDVVTTVASQIELGRELNERAGLSDRIRMVLADYADTGLDTEAYDGAWALESACQSPDASKRVLLDEAYRLLGFGGRLVIADGCLKGPPPRGITGRIHRRWARAWAIDELMRLDLAPAAARDAGFDAVRIEDWTWRVVPSLLHVPAALARFAWRERGHWREVVRGRREHLIGSALSLPLALRLDRFAYGALIAEKRADR